MGAETRQIGDGNVPCFELYIKHTKNIQSAIVELQFRVTGVCSG